MYLVSVRGCLILPSPVVMSTAKEQPKKVKVNSDNKLMYRLKYRIFRKVHTYKYVDVRKPRAIYVPAQTKQFANINYSRILSGGYVPIITLINRTILSVDFFPTCP